MSSKVAFFLVLVFYLAGERVPGRYELTNPDIEVTRGASRLTAKRAWVIPRA